MLCSVWYTKTCYILWEFILHIIINWCLEDTLKDLSRYAQISFPDKTILSEKLKILKPEKFLSLLQILYTDHKFLTGGVIKANCSVNNIHWKRNVFNNSRKRLEDIFARRLEDVLKISWRQFCKTSWRPLGKTSRGCLEDVLAGHLGDVLKTSWRRLEDVFNRYGQDQCLDQDFFWRRNSKGGIFVLTKVSWKRLHKTNVCWVVTTLKHFFLVMSPSAGAYSGVYSTISREPFNIFS